jgi:subtilase family serine protease
VRAAAEGVGMYFSSGDASGTGEPFAIAVGGTTLGLGKTGNRLFETGWSTGFSLLSKNGQRWTFLGEQGAAAGGRSVLWRQPSYQKGVVPHALAKPPAGNRGDMVRSTPDIGADADPFTGMAVGLLISSKKGQPLKFIEADFGGYDNMTGVGSPSGPKFIVALRSLEG